MTKKKDPKDLKKNGRPKADNSTQKEMLLKMAQIGLTDKQMAVIIGVTEQTINNWKKEDPVFFESLKLGKQEADSRVERSLFERAVGYEHPEDKIFNDNGKALIVPTTKHYPPDVTAAIFWLKNRKSKEWKDKHDITVEDKTAKFFEKSAESYGLNKKGS